MRQWTGIVVGEGGGRSLGEWLGGSDAQLSSGGWVGVIAEPVGVEEASRRFRERSRSGRGFNGKCNKMEDCAVMSRW